MYDYLALCVNNLALGAIVITVNLVGSFEV